MKSWILLIAMSLCGAGGVAASAHAQTQQEAAWRVINPVSPTVVPLYGAQPSPFLAVGSASQVTPTGPTPAELAHQHLLAATLSRARSQIMAANAIEPQLDGVQCNGALQGPLGWSALCGGRWIHTGAAFEVGVQAASTASNALSALTEIDSDSAAQLHAVLAQRVATTRLKLLVTGITATTVKLSAQGQTWQVPIRQSAD